MRNNFKTLILASFLAASTTASAGWTVGGGYLNISDSDDGDDINLGVAYASAGYEFTSSNLTVMPELRLGFGVSDDTLYGVNLEVDSYVAASVRAKLSVSDSVGVFVQPTYTRLELTASAGGQSASADDWELGAGAGLTFSISDNASVEALYEVIDGTDFISFGYRRHF